MTKRYDKALLDDKALLALKARCRFRTLRLGALASRLRSARASFVGFVGRVAQVGAHVGMLARWMAFPSRQSLIRYAAWKKVNDRCKADPKQMQMSRQDCPFCDIGSGGLPPHGLFEDDDTFVILDRKPLSFGHCMVVPKRHVVKLYALPPS